MVNLYVTINLKKKKKVDSNFGQLKKRKDRQKLWDGWSI